MHILIISHVYPSPQRTSRAIFIHDQALALQRKGAEVGVLVPNSPHPSRVFSGNFSWSAAVDSYTIDGVRVRNFMVFPVPFLHLPLTALLASVSFLRYVKEFDKPDVIHAHFIWYNGLIALLLGRIFKIPVVQTCHYTKHFYRIPVNNFWEACWVMDNVDYRISVSDFLKQRLIHLYGDHQIEVIPNVVNTDRMVLAANMPLRNSCFQYTSIGQLRVRKGFENLIRAFAMIGNLDSSILNIVGDGPDDKVLKNLASELGLDGKVVFHGRLTRENLLTLLQRTNVVVSASDLETFGVTIIEALSCGIPVLATRSGGPLDIINEKNGVLVEKGNIGELVRGLEKIFSSYAQFDPGVIRADCVNKYGYESIGGCLMRVYEDLIGKNAVKG